jgi:hypothetical protein
MSPATRKAGPNALDDLVPLRNRSLVRAGRKQVRTPRPPALPGTLRPPAFDTYSCSATLRKATPIRCPGRREPLSFSNTCGTSKSSFFAFAPLESRKETRGNRQR